MYGKGCNDGLRLITYADFQDLKRCIIRYIPISPKLIFYLCPCQKISIPNSRAITRPIFLQYMYMISAILKMLIINDKTIIGKGHSWFLIGLKRLLLFTLLRLHCKIITICMWYIRVNKRINICCMTFNYPFI